MKTEHLEPLTRRELKMFDRQAWDLISEMQAAGWTGRITNSSHAVMYAPDGETVVTLARDSKRGRSGRNARATFRRWQTAQREEIG